MVNTELHLVQLIIQYIRLLTTLMCEELRCAAIYRQVVSCVLRIVE